MSPSPPIPLPTRQYRTILDYESEDALREALLTEIISKEESDQLARRSALQQWSNAVTPPHNNCCGTLAASSFQYETSSADQDCHDADETDQVINLRYDWALPPYDPHTTETQSMKQELCRLQVLRTYSMIEAERIETFDCATRLTARTLNVPMCMVSLVDLGRTWLAASQGLGDTVEGARRHTFCAHAILAKSDVFVVPDALEDPRFKENIFVTGPPFVRFYASAALISPEGYRIGVFCVLALEPRPNGLSDDEEQTLRDMASMAVDGMVARRERLQREKNPGEIVAYAAHDLITPLTGLQLSLSLLEDDDEMKKLGGDATELLNTATRCAEIMMRISQTMDTMRRGIGSKEEAIIGKIKQIETTNKGFAINTDIANVHANKNKPRPLTKTSPPLVTDLTKLVENLYLMIEPLPKNVPLVIRLYSEVPNLIYCDDLKLYRLALNLLSTALERTLTGYVQLRIFAMLAQDEYGTNRRRDKALLSNITNCNYRSHACCISGRSVLVFECEDTGVDIPLQDHNLLFQPIHDKTGDGTLRFCLSSVASLIGSLNGQFGFRPRRLDTSSSDGGSAKSNVVCSGSIFWFSLPLVVVGNENAKDTYASMCFHRVAPLCAPPSTTPKQLSPVTTKTCQSNKAMSTVPTTSVSTILPSLPLGSTFSPPLALLGATVLMKNGVDQGPSPLGMPKQTMFVNGCDGCDGVLNTLRNHLTANDQHVQHDDLSSVPSRKRHAESTTGPSMSDEPVLSKTHSYCSERATKKQKNVCMDQFLTIQSNGDTKGVVGSDGTASDVSMVRPGSESPSNVGTKSVNDKAMSNNEMENRTTLTRTESQSSFKRQRKGLVIDDSLVIRKILSMALGELGFEVSLAVDGLDGLNRMKADLFDLVLCDFLMPVMDGLDCVKQYRAWETEHRPWFRQLIIGISAHANATVAEQGIAAGMDDFKPKPISIKLLREIESSHAVLFQTEQIDQYNQTQHDREEYITRCFS